MIDNYKVLWAKKPKSDDENCDDESFGVVSLQSHLEKTAEVAEFLWEEWLPPILKGQIDKAILVFLAYVHDIGKASPVFQSDNRNTNASNANEKIRNDLKKAGFPFSLMSPARAGMIPTSKAIHQNFLDTLPRGRR